MPDLEQQQICIKLCFKLEGKKKNAMKTSKILKVAFGEQKIEKFFSGFPSSTEAYLCQRHQMLRLSNNKETR
jgi:hypothetical protein